MDVNARCSNAAHKENMMYKFVLDFMQLTKENVTYKFALDLNKYWESFRKEAGHLHHQLPSNTDPSPCWILFALRILQDMLVECE